MKRIYVSILSLIAPFSQPVPAHPGHGVGEGYTNGLLHPFPGPDQLLLIVAVGAIFLLARKGLSKKLSGRDQE